MGEEAVDDYELHMVCYGGGGGDDDGRVMEWESGLPGADELTPLSQPLVPPGLAAAFRIPPEPGRTLLEVHRASAATVSRLRRAPSSSSGSGSSFAPFHPPGQGQGQGQAQAAARGDEGADSSAFGGGAATTNTNGTTNTNTKRPRLVWTPQLHKRFVDVVAHLGIKNAVPKTIMQLMNVEGLTRENVASHLQKYRLYVKRMQGLSNEGPSPSDHIFASTPVPHSLVHEPQQVPVPVPSSMYAMHAVGMVPMASGGQAAYHHYGTGAGGGGGGYPHPHPHPQAAYHHYHHAGK